MSTCRSGGYSGLRVNSTSGTGKEAFGEGHTSELRPSLASSPTLICHPYKVLLLTIQVNNTGSPWRCSYGEFSKRRHISWTIAQVIIDSLKSLFWNPYGQALFVPYATLRRQNLQRLCESDINNFQVWPDPRILPRR